MAEKNIASIKLQNFFDGSWHETRQYREVAHPMNGRTMWEMPDTQGDEIEPFLNFLKSCPKSGLHNPLKNNERYRLYGEVCRRAAEKLHQKDVEQLFTKLIQCVMPKSYEQALGEVVVTRDFLANCSGDQVRFLATGTVVPGERLGQQAHEYRFPHGPVIIIAPFNFPLEIPALQLIGALLMGNKVLVKGASMASAVIEQFLGVLLSCGLPSSDVALIHCNGITMEEIIRKSQPELVQFTGSSEVAEKLAMLTHGKIKIEDSGFNWKILGPDRPSDVLLLEYILWQCDKDAYAASGQKCSAQSLLFVHQEWNNVKILEKLALYAKRRKLEDLTIGPILSHSTDEMLSHIKKLLDIPGAKILWGGNRLTGHSIPVCYGAIEPTAIFLSLDTLLSPEYFKIATKEIFGPLQIVVEYNDDDIPTIIDIISRIKHKLTAAIVSNNQQFIGRILGESTNGTTYAGWLARTTGAPEWHGFRPSGVRAANLGTPEAIRDVWSYGRTIVTDYGPIHHGWRIPKST